MQKEGTLTRHSPGSLRELWQLAFPLMLMAFSTYGMIFVDRAILARYSLEAMNAAGVSSSFFMILHFGLMSIAMIAEVFVGQYNGRKEYSRIGEPVWQMLWLSLFTIAIFWPAGFCVPYYLPEAVVTEATPYARYLFGFGPVGIAATALSAFFIGRGQTTPITLVVILSNLINLVLDILFVFGWQGVIDPMGARGAAIATGISQVVQVAILFFLFLMPKNRARYHTHIYAFRPSAFLQCFKVGFPAALAHALAIACWAYFVSLISICCAPIYLTLVVICQNFWNIFAIITEGIGKAVTAICANFIGARMLDKIPGTIFNAFKLVFLFSIVLAVPLILKPEWTLNMFVIENATVAPEMLYEIGQRALFSMWFVFIFFGIYIIFIYQLTAAGDTQFIMWANPICAWSCLALPATIFIGWLKYSGEIAWYLIAFDMLVGASVFFLRYKHGKWKTLNIIEEQAKPAEPK